MMSDGLLNRDALIQTVAMKYGIIITKNDPMLVLLALHHEILGRYQEVMQQGFDGVQLNLDAIYERHGRGLKGSAEHYANQLVGAIMKEHANINNGVAVEMEKQRKLLAAVLDDNVGMMQKWMWVSLAAAGCSVVGLFLMFVLIKFF